jgi:hypothetical protein
MNNKLITVIGLLFAILISAMIVYSMKKPSPPSSSSKYNTKKVPLQTIQEYINSESPYTPKWPSVERPKLLTLDNVSKTDVDKLKDYLKYLYTAWDNIDSKDETYIYNFYNSLSLYYNSKGEYAPIYGQTTGWLGAPDTPYIPGGDDGGPNSVCTNECNPYCEPGFCSKVVPMSIAPLGYFAEMDHWLNDFSRKDDIMSIGQTGGPYGPTGQWVVKYVDDKNLKQDEVILKRSIYEKDILKRSSSIDMWSAFLGKGVSFLQGNTFHRAFWYPNGPPGQLKNPLNNSQIFVPVDTYSLDAPGLDYGMISSKTNKKITLNNCMEDIGYLLEYLDMKGDIPSIQWVPPHPDIAKRFTVPGRFWSGYKATKATDPSSDVYYYYIEHSRTDFGTNFAFTGNWIDVFEGAGLFYKYEKTLIAPNKVGGLLKLLFEITNGKASLTTAQYPLLRRILGVDYIYGNDAKSHCPFVYNDGKSYTNQFGVTQGMCMGVSMPGKTGNVVLDPTNPESGAQLWKEAYELGNKSDESMIFLGLIWILCNSPAHSPPNDTSFASGTIKSYGYETNTWSFFEAWCKAKGLNTSTPKDLLEGSKKFLMICAMGSGASPAENYMINQWQNTTIPDFILFCLGSSLNYDLIQLTLDITESNMWTRESLAIKIQPNLVQMVLDQLYAEGPHGGSFLVMCEQFGTHYTTRSPIFVNGMYPSNPMPFYRNPDPTAIRIGNMGPIGSPNSGEVVSYGVPFVSNSNFTTSIFKYYFDNGIITLRNPSDLSIDPSDAMAVTIKTQMEFILEQPYDRTVIPSDVVYKDEKAYVLQNGFPTNIPVKRRAQRCFGDWCSFMAKDSQTQGWSRQATGFSFG